MSSVNFQTCKPEKVLPLLPERLRVSQTAGAETTKNWFPMLIAAGAIAALAALFLSLAAHQILPSGMNAMSSLGGQITGYGVGVLGIILIVVGSIKSYPQIESKKADPNVINYYFPQALKDNEILVVDEGTALRICYRGKGDDFENPHFIPKDHFLPYQGDPQAAFKGWMATIPQAYSPVRDNSTCIDPATLCERVKDLEKKYQEVLKNSGKCRDGCVAIRERLLLSQKSV